MKSTSAQRFAILQNENTILKTRRSLLSLSTNAKTPRHKTKSLHILPMPYTAWHTTESPFLLDAPLRRQQHIGVRGFLLFSVGSWINSRKLLLIGLTGPCASPPFSFPRLDRETHATPLALGQARGDQRCMPFLSNPLFLLSRSSSPWLGLGNLELPPLGFTSTALCLEVHSRSHSTPLNKKCWPSRDVLGLKNANTN